MLILYRVVYRLDIPISFIMVFLWVCNLVSEHKNALILNALVELDNDFWLKKCINVVWCVCVCVLGVGGKLKRTAISTQSAN